MRPLVCSHQLPQFTIGTHCLGVQAATQLMNIKTKLELRFPEPSLMGLLLLGLVRTGPLTFQYQMQV